MLFLFKLHSIQSLWRLSFTLFMWLGQTHLARFMENVCWFGELEQQEGILSCSFSCPWLFWNCRKRHSICLTCGVRNTGFSTGGEKMSQHLLLDSRICLLFSSSNLLHFFVSAVPQLKGLNKEVKGAWLWDYKWLFFSTALCIWLLIQMLQMMQLEIHPFFRCQNIQFNHWR